MFGGSVLGLSSLRQRETKSNEPSEHTKQMQAYLAKYTGDKNSDPGKTKKKKKKAVVNQPEGIRIIEENNTGFHNSGAEEVVEDEGMAHALQNAKEQSVFMKLCTTQHRHATLRSLLAICNTDFACRGSSCCQS